MHTAQLSLDVPPPATRVSATKVSPRLLATLIGVTLAETAETLFASRGRAARPHAGAAGLDVSGTVASAPGREAAAAIFGLALTSLVGEAALPYPSR
jgi:hypothetical protein